ncbi:acyl-CoA reductase-like NAD-dependent aldehyde dehydrogenase [Novosphingobium gossypii]
MKRIYAPSALVEEVVGKLAAPADGFVLGTVPPGVTMAPNQNKVQFDKLRGFVAAAKAASGQVIAGGEMFERPGYFMRPAACTGLAGEAGLMDDEQFCPVIPVVTYDDPSNVVASIYAGPYGLTGSIWTAVMRKLVVYRKRTAQGR